MLGGKGDWLFKRKKPAKVVLSHHVLPVSVSPYVPEPEDRWTYRLSLLSYLLHSTVAMLLSSKGKGTLNKFLMMFSWTMTCVPQPDITGQKPRSVCAKHPGEVIL